MCETAFRFFKIKRSVERAEPVFGAPLGVTGSSAAQRDGGRVWTPAPTVDTETVPFSS